MIRLVVQGTSNLPSSSHQIRDDLNARHRRLLPDTSGAVKTTFVFVQHTWAVVHAESVVLATDNATSDGWCTEFRPAQALNRPLHKVLGTLPVQESRRRECLLVETASSAG